MCLPSSEDDENPFRDSTDLVVVVAYRSVSQKRRLKGPQSVMGDSAPVRFWIDNRTLCVVARGKCGSVAPPPKNHLIVRHRKNTQEESAGAGKQEKIRNHRA